jgi:hypothetical protein
MMGMAVRETVFHYCDVRFPCGRYFRKKALRTLRLHGNMRNTFFMSDAEEFDIEERQYNAGEQESPRCATCTGREHILYLDCEQGSQTKCVYKDGAGVIRQVTATGTFVLRSSSSAQARVEASIVL